jgi:hypothetical protein
VGGSLGAGLPTSRLLREDFSSPIIFSGCCFFLFSFLEYLSASPSQLRRLIHRVLERKCPVIQCGGAACEQQNDAGIVRTGTDAGEAGGPFESGSNDRKHYRER